MEGNEDKRRCAYLYDKDCGSACMINTGQNKTGQGKTGRDKTSRTKRNKQNNKSITCLTSQEKVE